MCVRGTDLMVSGVEGRWSLWTGCLEGLMGVLLLGLGVWWDVGEINGHVVDYLLVSTYVSTVLTPERVSEMFSMADFPLHVQDQDRLPRES